MALEREPGSRELLSSIFRTVHTIKGTCGFLAFGTLESVTRVGGNLKCMLPEPSQLSLPTVSLGAAHVVTVPGAGLLEHVELECDGDRLHIAVWNRRDDLRRDHHVELERTAQ